MLKPRSFVAHPRQMMLLTATQLPSDHNATFRLPVAGLAGVGARTAGSNSTGVAEPI